MNEGHEGSVRAGSRFLVDESHAFLLQARQRGADVGHAQRDVMQARPPLGDVLRDRRVGSRPLQQLQRGVAGGDERGPDVL
jgi:hypothetical protein